MRPVPPRPCDGRAAGARPGHGAAGEGAMPEVLSAAEAAGLVRDGDRVPFGGSGGGRQGPRHGPDRVKLPSLDGKEYLLDRRQPVGVAVIRATTAEERGNLTREREVFYGAKFTMACAARRCGGIDVAFQSLAELARARPGGVLRDRPGGLPARGCAPGAGRDHPGHRARARPPRAHRLSGPGRPGPAPDGRPALPATAHGVAAELAERLRRRARR